MKKWVIGSTAPEQMLDFLLERSSADDRRYICFDYFDTLVTRTVYPEYTKQMAAKLLSLAGGGRAEPGELYRLRSELEAKLCEQSAIAGGELEFYLDELAVPYLQIIRERWPQMYLGWSDRRFTQILLDIELSVEKHLQKPCREVVDVLKKLKTNDVETVLISDFYLPSSHFRQMLAYHGLDGLFDHVYISADHKVAKGSGRLYREIFNELYCRPDQLIMIGDNKHADVDMAVGQGIAAIHAENPDQQRYYQTWSQPEGCSAEIFQSSISSQQLSPFREFSSSMWFFIYRLFSRLSDNGIKDVFFFSKEGEFLKKLFDRFQTDLFGCCPITSHYLLVSRKATFLASLRSLDEEDFARLFNHYRDISCRDFLLSLNLEEPLAAKICEEAGLDFTARLTDLPNREEFGRLRKALIFRRTYEGRRVQQKENFVQYLDSFGVDYKDGLNIVDVGWKGSIQDNIFHILGQKIDVAGYYVGSLIASERRKNNRKQGLLFDDTPTLTPYFHVYNNNRSLYEMVLGASHGSADGYYTPEQFDQLLNDHQKVVSARVPGTSSKVYVTTLDLPEERALFDQDIRPLQERVFSGFCAMNQAFFESCCSVPQAEWFARQHARMVFKPSSAEVDFFERLYHLENFGVFEYTNFQAGSGVPFHKRIENLLKVVKSKTMLESGIWPPIILRRLGIGFYRHVDGYRRFQRVFKKLN